jgi:hypothetical protein
MAVDFGLNVVPAPLQWLWEIPGYWQELKHAVIHVDPEHPKHAQWVTCLVSMLPWKNWAIFNSQEMWTDPCDMGPCIIML